MSFLRMLNYIAYVLIAGFIFRYFFFEPPFLEYTNLPFPVENPVVAPGETVRLLVRRCNTEDKTRIYGISHMMRPVGDDKATPIVLPATQASVAPGCEVAISTINTVPSNVAPGMYYIDGYGEVQGTIRNHFIHWYSKPFEVVAPRGAK